jgi:hypothetical protein
MHHSNSQPKFQRRHERNERIVLVDKEQLLCVAALLQLENFSPLEPIARQVCLAFFLLEASTKHLLLASPQTAYSLQ